MRIINQKGNEIVNFDRITEIVANGNKIVITDNVYKNYGETIGVYKTEERASEVLEEIARKLDDADIVNLMENLQIALHDSEFGGSLASAYRMPKE